MKHHKNPEKPAGNPAPPDDPARSVRGWETFFARIARAGKGDK